MSVLKAYFASAEFTAEEKEILKAKVLSGSESEETKLTARVCSMSVPDSALKQKLWTEITDPDTKEPQKDLLLKMQCFFNRKHLELITPYFAKYYEIMPTVAKTRNREFTEVFIQKLSKV